MQINIQKCITWLKILGKGKQRWGQNMRRFFNWNPKNLTCQWEPSMSLTFKVNAIKMRQWPYYTNVYYKYTMDILI
jgi:hypothetical protein